MNVAQTANQIANEPAYNGPSRGIISVPAWGRFQIQNGTRCHPAASAIMADKGPKIRRRYERAKMFFSEASSWWTLPATPIISVSTIVSSSERSCAVLAMKRSPSSSLPMMIA